MKSSLKIYFLIFIFLIFSTYSVKYNEESVSFFFPVKEVIIENNSAVNLLELKSDLLFLTNTNPISLMISV